MNNDNVNVNKEGQAPEATSPETQTEKTYTETELLEAVQREADRRVSQALQTAERKSQAKIAEAQKLAQMNEQEKYEYQLKQREAQIVEKERELALLANKNEASKILSERGLSLALVDFVVAEDAETMKFNIDTLDKAFKASVKAEVEKRLRSDTPRKNLPLDNTITRAQFLKMSVSELSRLAAENPDLYNQLSQ